MLCPMNRRRSASCGSGRPNPSFWTSSMSPELPRSRTTIIAASLARPPQRSSRPTASAMRGWGFGVWSLRFPAQRACVCGIRMQKRLPSPEVTIFARGLPDVRACGVDVHNPVQGYGVDEPSDIALSYGQASADQEIARVTRAAAGQPDGPRNDTKTGRSVRVTGRGKLGVE